MTKTFESPPAATAHPSITLDGRLAAAYEEWRAAAAQLEGTFAVWQAARERHAVALAAFTRLATDGKHG